MTRIRRLRSGTVAAVRLRRPVGGYPASAEPILELPRVPRGPGPGHRGQVEPQVAVRAPLPPDPPAMTPAKAREILRHRVASETFVPMWMDMELLGGTPRQRRRYLEDQRADKLAAQERIREVEKIAALPDGDLQWLLDVGWDPATA